MPLIRFLQRSIFAILILAAPLIAGEAANNRDGVLIWHFEQGISNEWGGRYNAYKREPSSARTYLDSQVTRKPPGYSLRIAGNRERAGFCGVWLDFHPAAAVPRQYFDATSYNYLSFWAKGQKGGEDLEVALTDAAHISNEEARKSLPLRAYLPHGLSTSWQRVLIPLEDFGELDRSRLVRMTLNIARRGNFRFYLDDIGFQRDATASIPAVNQTTARAAESARRGTNRALWVWKTEALLDQRKPREANRFFAFCASRGIKRVYLAAEFDRSRKGGKPHFAVRNPAGYRAFLGRAHRRGLKVDALAGTPEWAVRENHAQALAAVEALLAFNQAAPSAARFDGIHFDVEPYLLIGYNDPSYRSEILLGLVEMVSKCAGLARSEGNLHFSCDVPSWFYPSDGIERDRLMVKFRGQEKTVGEHLTDLLDSVTIMDYTNQADGAGGIIARGLPALEYAARQNKKIIVGIETFREDDSKVSFVCGLPAEEFRARLAKTGLRNQYFFEDYRMSVCSDGVNMHIGLTAPRETARENHALFEGALVQLARQLGAAPNLDEHSLSELLELAKASLAPDPEWEGFEPFEIIDAESGRTIPGFRSVRRMLPSITFHALGREVFQEEFDSTVDWLGRQRSFGGMAIHFYDSFRELMEGE